MSDDFKSIFNSNNPQMQIIYSYKYRTIFFGNVGSAIIVSIKTNKKG